MLPPVRRHPIERESGLSPVIVLHDRTETSDSHHPPEVFQEVQLTKGGECLLSPFQHSELESRYVVLL